MVMRKGSILLPFWLFLVSISPGFVSLMYSHTCIQEASLSLENYSPPTPINRVLCLPFGQQQKAQSSLHYSALLFILPPATPSLTFPQRQHHYVKKQRPLSPLCRQEREQGVVKHPQRGSGGLAKGHRTRRLLREHKACYPMSFPLHHSCPADLSHLPLNFHEEPRPAMARLPRRPTFKWLLGWMP